MSVRGVWKADVVVPSGNAKIVYDPNQCSVRQVVEAIESGGYAATLVQESVYAGARPRVRVRQWSRTLAGALTAMRRQQHAEQAHWATYFMIAAVLSIPVVIVSMVIPDTGGLGVMVSARMRCVSMLAIFACGCWPPGADVVRERMGCTGDSECTARQ
jgi:cation transport ATPase